MTEKKERIRTKLVAKLSLEQYNSPRYMKIMKMLNDLNRDNTWKEIK